MKVYVRAPMSDKRLRELREIFKEVVYEPWNDTGERYYESEMLAHLLKVKPDILITELDRITDKVLDGYNGLQVIGDCRANPANIDINACNRHKIPVLCTPARNCQAVAEMLVGLLINFMRNILPAVQWAKEGNWKEGTTPYYLWMGNELQGKTVGFVGFGAVGHTAANLLKSFGCDILYYDPFVKADEDAFRRVGLEDIFRFSDIVSIHLPVNASTRNMIDRKLLSLMKSTAIFVNTARSAVVDNDALLEILKSNKIRGAILDVLPQEPPKAEEFNKFDLPNVLLTPHICGASYEVTDHQSDIIVDRLRNWMLKRDLERTVFNYKELEHDL